MRHIWWHARALGTGRQKGTLSMRFVSDLFLLLALYIVVRFLDGMQYGLAGWSLFTFLGFWDPP